MKLSEKRGNMLHGILLIALFSCGAFYIGDIPLMQKLSFSPLIIGIILGMLYANSLQKSHSGNMGTRHTIQFQATSKIRYHLIRFQINVSKYHRSRIACKLLSMQLSLS